MMHALRSDNERVMTHQHSTVLYAHDSRIGSCTPYISLTNASYLTKRLRHLDRITSQASIECFG